MAARSPAGWWSASAWSRRPEWSWSGSRPWRRPGRSPRRRRRWRRCRWHRRPRCRPSRRSAHRHRTACSPTRARAARAGSSRSPAGSGVCRSRCVPRCLLDSAGGRTRGPGPRRSGLTSVSRIRRGRDGRAPVGRQRPNSAAAFVDVASAISSASRPLRSAMNRPTWGTHAGRFGLPRWGIGAR